MVSNNSSIKLQPLNAECRHYCRGGITVAAVLENVQLSTETARKYIVATTTAGENNGVHQSILQLAAFTPLMQCVPFALATADYGPVVAGNENCGTKIAKRILKLKQ